MAYRGNKTGKFSEISHLVNGPGDDDKLTVRDIENQNKSIQNAYKNFTGKNATFSPSEVNFSGNKRQYKDDEGRSMIETTLKGSDEVDVQPFSSLTNEERNQYGTSRQELVDDAFWKSDEGKDYLSKTKDQGRYFNTRSGDIEYTQNVQKPTEASQFWEEE